MAVIVRPAVMSESAILTEISFKSKHYWDYPEAYFKVWQAELTITPAYIQNNLVYAAERDGEIIGYAAIVQVKVDFLAGKVFVQKGFWLEHIFVIPEAIGKGVGSALLNYIKSECRKMRISTLLIFADPNARGFYDKAGASYQGESPSSIEGRMVSLYELEIK